MLLSLFVFDFRVRNNAKIFVRTKQHFLKEECGKVDCQCEKCLRCKAKMLYKHPVMPCILACL